MLKTKTLIFLLLGALSLVYLGFWGSIALLCALALLSRALGTVFRFIWAVLTWDGRLLDNPLFQNRLCQLNVSNLLKKGYARLTTRQ